MCHNQVYLWSLRGSTSGMDMPKLQCSSSFCSTSSRCLLAIGCRVCINFFARFPADQTTAARLYSSASVSSCKQHQHKYVSITSIRNEVYRFRDVYNVRLSSITTDMQFAPVLSSEVFQGFRYLHCLLFRISAIFRFFQLHVVSNLTLS